MLLNSMNLTFKGYQVQNVETTTVDEVDSKTLAHEAEILARVTKADIPGTQHLFAIQKTLVTGSKANPITNPITKEHFVNLLNTLYRLDESGIYHGDIDPAHVFYKKDGSINLDFFRFGKLFDFRNTAENKNNSPNVPEFMMPSNAFMFEHASLNQYLSKVEDRELADNLFKSYIKATAHYHTKRADYLAKQENVPQEMLEYEQLQAEFLKNPSDEIIDLRKNRMLFLYQQREAFTEWDEGGGACGHTPNSQKQAGSVLGWLNTISTNINFIKKANELESKTDDPKLKKYYSFEKRLGEYWLNNYQNWVSGMANWACEGIMKIEDNEVVQRMNTNFENIKNDDNLNTKLEKIEQYKQEYQKLYDKKFKK